MRTGKNQTGGISGHRDWRFSGSVPRIYVRRIDVGAARKFLTVRFAALLLASGTVHIVD